jgi:hypothetical protein
MFVFVVVIVAIVIVVVLFVLSSFLLLFSSIIDDKLLQANVVSASCIDWSNTRDRYNSENTISVSLRVSLRPGGYLKVCLFCAQ